MASADLFRPQSQSHGAKGTGRGSSWGQVYLRVCGPLAPNRLRRGGEGGGLKKCPHAAPCPPSQVQRRGPQAPRSLCAPNTTAPLCSEREPQSTWDTTTIPDQNGARGRPSPTPPGLDWCRSLDTHAPTRPPPLQGRQGPPTHAPRRETRALPAVPQRAHAPRHTRDRDPSAGRVLGGEAREVGRDRCTERRLRLGNGSV